MIDKAVADGATVATGGGQSPGRGGLFVEPTVLTDVRPDMPIAQEEVFGPVLAVTRFSTEDEALALANGTKYGLAAGVWTVTCNAHIASRLPSPPALCGSTPTEWSDRAYRSAVSRAADGAEKTDRTQSSNSPKPRRCGSN